VAAFYQTVRYSVAAPVKKNEETPSAEKVTAEKVTAEKVAADKVAAEKVAAEKINEETTHHIMEEVSRRVRGVKVTKEPGE
jgi:hypothetical protein